ncbi:hypothetical protein GA0061098_1004183 [Bradyrhizobium shewense]|uniref:Uncharacterized protein n=1 Tax=Bradyrhizobium shewense TaxID=1761772 RepID=A0A1C3VGD3_9BRAD|nr:hypothetical protein GA0061098_1004183 [Bradyrhizobium shewense]
MTFSSWVPANDLGGAAKTLFSLDDETSASASTKNYAPADLPVKDVAYSSDAAGMVGSADRSALGARIEKVVGSAKDGSRIALSYKPSAISAHFNMRSPLRNASTAGSSDAGAPGPTKAVAATMSQR